MDTGILAPGRHHRITGRRPVDFSVANKKILVLEDRMGIGAEMAAALAPLGAHVFPTLGPEDLVHRVHREKVDLVLIDATLTEFDGIRLMSDVRSRLRPGQFLPMVVAVAHDDEERRGAAFAQGAADVIVKPAPAAEIAARVETSLHTKWLYDQLAEARRTLAQERNGLVLALRELFPQSRVEIPGWLCEARHVSTDSDASDFFDVFPLGEGAWGIALGDILGNGARAATHMAMAKAVVRSQLRSGATPGSALERLNELLVGGNDEEGELLSLYVARLELDGARLTHSTAGHPGPMIHRLEDGAIESLPVAGGPPLGVDAVAAYADNTAEVPARSRLLFATNGIWQQKDAKGEAFGLERFEHLVRATPSLAPEDTVEFLLDTVTRHAGGATRRDDMVLVLLERC